MKIYILSITGYCGSEGHDFFDVPDNYTEDQLNTLAHDVAINNAEMHGIYPEAERREDMGEDEDQYSSEEYSDNIEGIWYPYVPEEHDGFTVTGTPHFQ